MGRDCAPSALNGRSGQPFSLSFISFQPKGITDSKTHMRLMADVRLELRGGGRTHGGMKVQAEGKQVVMDMRSPEERALAAAAEEEERRARYSPTLRHRQF